MPTPIALACDTFDRYLADVIEPAVVSARAPLSAAAWLTAEPVAFALAAAAEYAPVETGYVWGPVWGTCWFRLRGTVPATFKPGCVALGFSTETEGLVFVGGQPYHGLDVNREIAMMGEHGKPGEAIEWYVEAACNHTFGGQALAWDGADVHRRWKSETPGRFLRCEMCEIDPVVSELADAWRFASGLIRELDPGAVPGNTPAAPWAPNQPLLQNTRAEQLRTALMRAIRAINDRDVAGTAAAALAEIRCGLTSTPPSSATVGYAVGHAHIDTAWLWPLRETRRKCQRTFANVLRLMEQHAGMTFMCSQAQQYAFIERDAPGLFGQIKQRVAEGRWEPTGAMWIEPDCHVPSAESLVRQVLHGTRYWQSRFGGEDRGTYTARQRLLFLPDTFGFPAVLPTVMAHCGLDTFVTNKMHWNASNPFPHTSFWWYGADGSRVAAHVTPNADYNASNAPKELIRADKNHRSKQVGAAMDGGDAAAHRAGPRFLHPYGFGDGGGGPNLAMVRAVDAAAACDGVPVLRHARSGELCDALHRDLLLAESNGEAPTWHGELYLELHRGTLTTHARLKRLNVECEEALQAAELLVCYAMAYRWELARDWQATLDTAWKTLLLNQFHDIMPGSSITWVYQDAYAQLESVLATVKKLRGTLMEQVAGHIGAAGGTTAYCNAFDETVECVEPGAGAGRKLRAWGVPAFCCAAGGVVPLGDDDDEVDIEPVRVETDKNGRSATLSNKLVSITVDHLGRIASLREQVDGDSVQADNVAAGPLLDLMLYEDRPRAWEAWDIDADYAHKRLKLGEESASWKMVKREAAVASLEVVRALTATSTATITITLRAGSSHVDVAMKIDWQESNRLLRCVFPTNISNPSAWFDCHGVAVSRPVHRNTAVQQAAFEVPASGSAMLRGGIDTLHVTARGCFGWSALGATLGVSLLRATTYPDPTADRGTHEFAFTLRHATLADSTLSVCSRPGRTIADLDSALVPATLAGARTSQAGGGQAATQGRGVLQLVSQPDAETNIAAIKPAEDGSRAVIVRLRTYGQPDGTAALDFHAKAIAACWVDGLELPVAGAPKLRLESDGRIELVGLKPGLSAVRIDLSA